MRTPDLVFAEYQAYRAWTLSCSRLTAASTLLARLRKQKPDEKFLILAAEDNHRLAVELEMHAYDKWVKACNRLDEHEANLHDDNTHPHA